MPENQDKLKPDKFFHLYNHGNGSDSIFFNEANYIYFLTKFKEYISPIADTYAYCLLPNHFHLLLKFKAEEEIFKFLKENDKLPDENITLSEFKALTGVNIEIDFFGLHISKQFSNLFNGYSQAINKQEGRKGSLFSRSFKRKEIDSSEYLKSLILYIHTNPIHHQFAEKISDWKYSSYQSMISDLPTSLKRKEVVEMFNDLNNFKVCHEQFKETLIAEMDAEIEK